MTIEKYKQLPQDKQKKCHIDWLIAGLCILPSLVIMIGIEIFM